MSDLVLHHFPEDEMESPVQGEMPSEDTSIDAGQVKKDIYEVICALRKTYGTTQITVGFEMQNQTLLVTKGKLRVTYQNDDAQKKNMTSRCIYPHIDGMKVSFEKTAREMIHKLGVRPAPETTPLRIYQED